MNWRESIRRLLPYLIASAAGFLLAYLAVFTFVFPSGMLPDDAVVPEVVGLDYTDASLRLEAAGYRAERGLRRFNASSPDGTVLSQAPRSGTPLVRGTPIVLDVSAGEQSAEVPPVVGASEEDARALITTAGFAVGSVRREPTASVATGAVAGSDPPPGQRVVLPARVDLVLSSGPPAVAVPDLIGRPLDDARRLLAAVGLRVGNVAVDAFAIELPNTVTSQSVNAGSTVDAGTAVGVTVAGISGRPVP